MTSAINTNSLNINYPVPGVNNNSQGFRNNFQNIKLNLDTAAQEITDLQDSVVVKNQIGNTVINNDMGNVLISNCATLSFRSTMYNLGSALTGTVLVNLAVADVHYGTLDGNIVLNFGSWAPTGTLSKVVLQLSTANVANNYSITFPGEVIVDNENSGGALLNNFELTGSGPTITFPHNCTQLNLECYSMDCGNTVYVTPINRPFQSVQILTRSPSPVGNVGDVAGTVAVDANYLYVCTGTFDSGGSNAITGTAVSTTAGTNVITFSPSLGANVVANMPVMFDTMKINNANVTSFGNINAGQIYFVKTISGANITISETRSGGVAGSTLTLTTVSANSGSTYMDATFYAGSNIWKRVELTNW